MEYIENDLMTIQLQSPRFASVKPIHFRYRYDLSQYGFPSEEVLGPVTMTLSRLFPSPSQVVEIKHRHYLVQNDAAGNHLDQLEALNQTDFPGRGREYRQHLGVFVQKSVGVSRRNDVLVDVFLDPDAEKVHWQVTSPKDIVRHPLHSKGTLDLKSRGGLKTLLCVPKSWRQRPVEKPTIEEQPTEERLAGKPPIEHSPVLVEPTQPPTVWRSWIFSVLKYPFLKLQLLFPWNWRF